MQPVVGVLHIVEKHVGVGQDGSEALPLHCPGGVDGAVDTLVPQDLEDLRTEFGLPERLPAGDGATAPGVGVEGPVLQDSRSRLLCGNLPSVVFQGAGQTGINAFPAGCAELVVQKMSAVTEDMRTGRADLRTLPAGDAFPLREADLGVW